MVVSRMLDEFEQSGNIDEKDKPQISRLREEVRRVHGAGIQNLPTALVHRDLVPVNIIAAPTSGKRHAWTVVDWAGAGVGPRVLSLGFILCTAVMRGKIEAVDAVMKGYHSTEAKIKPAELDERLSTAIYERSLVIQCWEVAVGRAKAADVVKRLEEMFEMAEKVARRVREAVGALSRSNDIQAK
jgi:Ser/Thr protein kinase RdoA (MazF antagonist)